MSEPEDHEHRVERRVVYETVSGSSTRHAGWTIGIIVVLAVALIVWVVMQMR